jgi:hypothetical protein
MSGGGRKESDMITRRAIFGGFTGALVVTMGATTPPALATSRAAGAVQACWDFSTLPQANVYRIGDVFRTPRATIEMKHYLSHGIKHTNDGAQSYAQQTQIAGGPAPEFRMYMINAHVEPDTPVNSVTFDFGLYLLAGEVHANLGVNGELVEVTTTLADLNGRMLGDPALGTVQVNVNMTTPAGASPEKGTVELVAQGGQISKWTFGGRNLYLDNICF